MAEKIGHIIGTLIGTSMSEKPIALFILSGHPIFSIIWVIAVAIERREK